MGSHAALPRRTAHAYAIHAAEHAARGNRTVVRHAPWLHPGRRSLTWRTQHRGCSLGGAQTPKPRRSDSIEAPGFGPPRSYGRTDARRPHRTDAQAAPPPHRPRRQHRPRPPPDRPAHQPPASGQTGTRASRNNSPDKTPANSHQTKAKPNPEPKPRPKPKPGRSPSPSPYRSPDPTRAEAQAPPRADTQAQRHPPSARRPANRRRQPASRGPTSPRPPVGPRPTWPARCRRPRPSRAPAARCPTGAATRVRWRRVRAPRR